MKGKGATHARSWAHLPPELLTGIASHILLMAQYDFGTPKPYDAPQLWQEKMLFVALRDAKHVEQSMMRVCRGWRAPLEHHPFWMHALALIDPLDFAWSHAWVQQQHAANSNNQQQQQQQQERTGAGSAAAAAEKEKEQGNKRVTPYAHYKLLVNTACVVCRINSLNSADGLLTGRRPSPFNVPGIGTILTCKDHCPERRPNAYCGVCLRRASPQSAFDYYGQQQQAQQQDGGGWNNNSAHMLAILENEDLDSFCGIQATCRTCRESALISYATHLSLTRAPDALLSIGGNGMEHHPRLDWESRSAIDLFVDSSEGDVRGVVRVCREKMWLGRETQLVEFVKQGVMSRRVMDSPMGTFGLDGEGGGGGKKTAYVDGEDIDYLTDSEEEEEDPTDMSIAEECGAREMALADWARTRVLRGDWRSTADLFVAREREREACGMGRKRSNPLPPARTKMEGDVVPVVRPCEWAFSRPGSPVVPTTSSSARREISPDADDMLVEEDYAGNVMDTDVVVAAAGPGMGVPVQEQDYSSCTTSSTAESSPVVSASLSLPNANASAKRKRFADDAGIPPTWGLAVQTDTALLRAMGDVLGGAMRNVVRRVVGECQVAASAPSGAGAGSSGVEGEKEKGKGKGKRREVDPVRVVQRLGVEDVLRMMREEEEVWVEEGSVDWRERARVRFKVLDEDVRRREEQEERERMRREDREDGAVSTPSPESTSTSTTTTNSTSTTTTTTTTGSADTSATSPELTSSSATSSLGTSPSPPPRSPAQEQDKEKEVKVQDFATVEKVETETEGSLLMMGLGLGHGQEKLIHPIPYVPVSMEGLGVRAVEGLGSIWRQALAPLYHCKCGICLRAKRLEEEKEAREREERVRKQEEEERSRRVWNAPLPQTTTTTTTTTTTQQEGGGEWGLVKRTTLDGSGQGELEGQGEMKLYRMEELPLPPGHPAVVNQERERERGAKIVIPPASRRQYINNQRRADVGVEERGVEVEEDNEDSMSGYEYTQSELDEYEDDVDDDDGDSAVGEVEAFIRAEEEAALREQREREEGERRRREVRGRTPAPEERPRKRSSEELEGDYGTSEKSEMKKVRGNGHENERPRGRMKVEKGEEVVGKRRSPDEFDDVGEEGEGVGAGKRVRVEVEGGA